MPQHPSSAARTNLTSQRVRISNCQLGEGVFRICLEGTYIGGNRNQQAAACKRFKPEYCHIEDEYFAADFRVAEKCIDVAEKWNDFCEYGKEITFSYGDVTSRGSTKYLVEPLIRYFCKYTSNNGFIANDEWEGRAMEAFSHFSYHATGGQMLICDLQGRYRYNRYSKEKSRFELTDPAICSRTRKYGPTDLGEKGIESFFANHECNRFCQSHWQRPRNVCQWFPRTAGTSMLSSRSTYNLTLQSGVRFTLGMSGIIEEDHSSDSDSDTPIVYF